uniref:MBL fold metallo-hydrolase n=1 Tax=Rothia dentocariosa TaxID=2047 RepID=UPI003FA3B457
MATTIELADGVYRIATDNYCLNTGLILGLEKALVIDTGAGPRQATEIYDEVRRITRMPLVVVNTHAHPERYFGNDVFAAMGTEEFWSHPRAARAIKKYGDRQRLYVETLEPEMAHHQGAATDIVVPNHLVAQSGEGITFTPVDLGSARQPSSTWVPAIPRAISWWASTTCSLRAVCWSRGPTHPLKTLSPIVG